MNFSFHVLSAAEKKVIDENLVVVPPGILYFKRMENPTKATIDYTTERIGLLAQEQEISQLIFDVRGRVPINTHLRLYMGKKIIPLARVLKYIVVIIDPTANNQMAISFAKHMKFYTDFADVQFCQTFEEGISYLSSIHPDSRRRMS